MGARKRLRAEKLKAQKRVTAVASLRDCPSSPRKMRLVADMIRGVEINKALGMLRYSKKEASNKMEKLLRSAIANWEAKNQGESLEGTLLCVKTIQVDQGRQLKRIQPAPQGRAHRIRKRSNHVTVVVDRMVTSTTASTASATPASAAPTTPTTAGTPVSKAATATKGAAATKATTAKKATTTTKAAPKSEVKSANAAK